MPTKLPWLVITVLMFHNFVKESIYKSQASYLRILSAVNTTGTHFRWHIRSRLKGMTRTDFTNIQATNTMYLKKAGLASRNIVHIQKILPRCVDFCFYFLRSIREADHREES